jgi:hypothetical protein
VGRTSQVGLRYLTPVPWLKMRFKHPKFPLISPSTGHLIVDANFEILDKRTMASSNAQVGGWLSFGSRARLQGYGSCICATRHINPKHIERYPLHHLQC